MKAKYKKQWAVCVDGSPVVLRRGQRAAMRSMGEFRRAMPDLGGMTVEPVLCRVTENHIYPEGVPIV